MTEDLRPLLLSIAYRMLGSFGDAEDVVQEAYLRLHRAGAVDNVKAFLTTVTTRLAIDQLRSARVRRETYPGPWLPEPAVDEYADLSEDAVLSDSLSTAFLVLLERLSPEQRAVFLLRDVFGYSFDEIARIVAKTPAACREGDLDGLLALLAADVTFTGDGGGKAQGLPRPVHGRDAVGRLLRGMLDQLSRHRITIAPTRVGGHPGAWLTGPGGALVAVWSFEVAGGEVVAIRSVVNPDELGHLPMSQNPMSQD